MAAANDASIVIVLHDVCSWFCTVQISPTMKLYTTQPNAVANQTRIMKQSKAYGEYQFRTKIYFLFSSEK